MKKPALTRRQGVIVLKGQISITPLIPGNVNGKVRASGNMYTQEDGRHPGISGSTALLNANALPEGALRRCFAPEGPPRPQRPLDEKRLRRHSRRTRGDHRCTSDSERQRRHANLEKVRPCGRASKPSQGLFLRIGKQDRRRRSCGSCGKRPRFPSGCGKARSVFAERLSKEVVGNTWSGPPVHMFPIASGRHGRFHRTKLLGPRALIFGTTGGCLGRAKRAPLMLPLAGRWFSRSIMPRSVGPSLSFRVPGV